VFQFNQNLTGRVSVEILLLDLSKGLRALKRIPVTSPLTSMVSSASATLEVFSRLKYFASAGRKYVFYTLLHEAGRYIDTYPSSFTSLHNIQGRICTGIG
jgi:hypothetical protein